MTSAQEEILARSSLFRSVPEEQRGRLGDLFRLEEYQFGDLIIKQGEEADAFYVLLSGRARVVKMTDKGQELSLNTLQSGDEFGEVALLDGGARQVSVRCSSTVTLLRLDRSAFLDLLREFPEFRTYLELSARWHALHDFLYKFSNFGRLPGPALQTLMRKLEPVDFKEGEIVVREGDPAGPLFIIQQGRVHIYSGAAGQRKNLRFQREGDFFGELSILTNAPRTATVQAVTSCHLLALAPEAVRDLAQQFPEFARLMEERRSQYRADQEARVPLDFSSEVLPAEAALGNKTEVDERSTDPKSRAPGDEEPFADENGLFRKRKRRIRSVPFVQQIDEMDCGAASLAMICRHFGRKVSLSRIRQLCHTSYDGTSLKALSHAATELGLASRALKVSLRNLPHMPLPAIVHWDGNHWMVLVEVGKDFVNVADPAIGPRRVPRAEFEQKWSGYAALFDYTSKFEQAPVAPSTMTWMLPFFSKFKIPLLQALFLSAVGTVLQLLFPIFTQVIVDQAIVGRDLGMLKLTVLGMGMAGFFMLATNLVEQYLLSFVAVHIDSGILDFLTRQMLALPMSYFNSRRTGDIQRRLDGARQVRTFLISHGIGALLAVLQIVGCVVMMATYSLQLLAVFFITIPFYGALMIYSVKVLRPMLADLEEGQGKYSSYQIDSIKGIEAVKAAAAESVFRDMMLNEFLSLSRKRLRSSFLMMSYESALVTISLFSTSLFLWLGASMVIKGEISIGGFMAFSGLLTMAYGGVMRALGVWDDLQMMVVLMNRLNDIFEQEPEQGRDRSRLKPVPTLEGQIELKNVGFRYGGPEAPAILEDLNLEIAAGKTIAIVGRSGSGKTTFIKLIAGLIEPTEGSILFDRVELKTLNYRDVRRKIGLVLQENHLFSDTILRNISFGDPEPDFDRVLRATQMANAHEFIMRLPLGYETKIGESGLALSGGQKQRICIARAVYHDPPLLIFDEATSALDTESERAIQGNMTRLMKGRTSLIIAHRLSTIRDADAIIVLEKGKVAEMGTHDELMARRGLYFYLSSQQMAI